MTFKVFCFLLLVAKTILAGPQQIDLSSRIEEIFGNSGNRGGFGEIVEPENLPPTERPQTLLVNNGKSCKCVPYHLCKPDSDRLITTDSRFFGDIDIRYGESLPGDVVKFS